MLCADLTSSSPQDGGSCLVSTYSYSAEQVHATYSMHVVRLQDGMVRVRVSTYSVNM